MAAINVIKRGNYWQYRFDIAKIDGKRKQVSKSGFKTKKEALEAGTKALAEYNDSGMTFKPSDISVSDYFDYWIENYCKTNLKETTVEGYKKKIRLYLKPAFGNYYLKSLKPSVIQEFIDKKFNEGFSRNTLTCLKGILTGSLDYAIEPCGFIKQNPAMLVRMPLQRAKPNTPTRKKTKRPVTDQEWNQIIKRFPEGHTAHIPLILAYRCGFRIGEVFGLMWDDVDFKSSTITIQRQVQKLNGQKHWHFYPPKYDSYRTVSVDPKTMELLKREYDKQQRAKIFYAEHHITLYAANFDHTDHLFDSGYISTTPTKTIVNMVMQRDSGEYIQQRIMQHVGRIIHGVYNENTPCISADWDFHSLRITHASKLREQGIPEVMIQERLGHTDIEMTEHYIKPTEKMKNDLNEKLIDMFK